MTKLFCVLALLVVAARATPLERTLHAEPENDETADAPAEEAVEDDSLRTHFFPHAAVGKKVEVTVKKVFAKEVPVVVAPEVADEPAPEPVLLHHHHAHVHPPHHPHAHAPPATPAPVAEVVEAEYAPPAAPVAVVLDNNPIALDKAKIAAILKKLLSGAINKVNAYDKPPAVPYGGKPVAVIFSATTHVVELGTLKTLVSAQAAAVGPSYDASNVKVEVAKLADPYVAPATYPAKAKPIVVTAAKYAAPAAVVAVKPAYVAAAVTTPSYPPKAYAAAAKAPAYKRKAYAAAAVVPVTTPAYAAPTVVEVAAVDADAYAPAPVVPVKKYKKIVVAKDDY